jgi:hypothetical protein
MEVFVVTENVAYQGSEAKAIFSTYEKAKEYVEKNYDEEWEFDGKCWNYYGNESENISIETFNVDED